MNNCATAPAAASPRLTPAEEGERAAWCEANGYHPDPVMDNLDRFTNRMLHGDCLQLLRCLPDECADMVLTDPPYLVRYKDRAGRTIANDDNTRWMFPAFAEMFRVLKPDSYCVSFYGWSKADRFLSVWRECGFYPVGHFVWAKMLLEFLARDEIADGEKKAIEAELARQNLPNTQAEMLVQIGGHPRKSESDDEEQNILQPTLPGL